MKAQLAYKEKVPFVDIPRELIAQWENHTRMLDECGWYFDMFSKEELELTKKLDFLINKFCQKDTEDIPEVFENPVWQEIIQQALIFYKIYC